jgi:hypothetical protein
MINTSNIMQYSVWEFWWTFNMHLKKWLAWTVGCLRKDMPLPRTVGTCPKLPVPHGLQIAVRQCQKQLLEINQLTIRWFFIAFPSGQHWSNPSSGGLLGPPGRPSLLLPGAQTARDGVPAKGAAHFTCQVMDILDIPDIPLVETCWNMLKPVKDQKCGWYWLILIDIDCPLYGKLIEPPIKPRFAEPGKLNALRARLHSTHPEWWHCSWTRHTFAGRCNDAPVFCSALISASHDVPRSNSILSIFQ